MSEAPLPDEALLALSNSIDTVEDVGQEIVDTFRLKLAAKHPHLTVYFTGGKRAVTAVDTAKVNGKGSSGKAPAQPPPEHLYEFEYNYRDEEEWPLFVDEPLRATVEFCRHLEDVRLFHPVIERIAYRHISRDVGDTNYSYAASCLLSAINDVIGPDLADDMTINAWRLALDALTAMLVATEADLIEQIKATEGGFVGFKSFVIVSEIKHPNGAKTLKLATGESDPKPVPEHRGGQYVSIKLGTKDGLSEDVYVTAKVSDVSRDVLGITLFPSLEPGVKELFLRETGDLLQVSVPCGRFIVDAEDVEGMPDMVVAGRAEDGGMLVAVGKDLLASGVEEVTILVEGDNSDGYVAVALAEKSMKVGVVEYVSVDVLMGMSPSGVLAAPALRDAVSELYEAGEEDVYIKVIE